MTLTVHRPPDQLRQAVEKALKQWQDNNAAVELASLALFQKLHRAGNRTSRQTANELLLAGLNALEAEKPRLAKLLRLRFLNYIPVDQTANQLGVEEPTIYGLQRDAFTHLTRLLWQQEAAARAEQQQSALQRLAAPTYTNLVGIDAHLVQLQQLLTQTEPPWLVAIEGLGGIGKTALANALVRTLLDLPAVGEVGWVTARQPDFDLGGGLASLQQPALSCQELIQKLVEQLATANKLITTLPTEKQLEWLQLQLKAAPHLIVIDNLETRLDVETLLPLLRQLWNPTRFLLTSREHCTAESGLYHFTIPELCEAHTLQLLRQEARLGNLAHLAAASDDELRPIYTTVGGNPLALRLVLGQTHTDSLELILADLAQARGAKVEQLYAYIYRRAWERLDEAARYVWLTLPLLATPQATAAAVVEISSQPLSVVRTALDQLVRLNLVNCHGGINSRFYSLHNLTRTFLQEQVGQWH